MSIGRRGKVLAVVVGAGACLSLTCSEDRIDSVSPTYRTDVQALFEKRCVQCHGDVNPAGGWRATSYLGAVSCLTDGRPATLPADDGAPVLRALDSESHRTLLNDGERAVLTSWVKSGTLAFPENEVHPSGFADPRTSKPAASGVFHADFLRREKWGPIRNPDDEHVCGRCHEGAPVRPEKVTLGAPGATACTSCHTDPKGPLGCTTCHGDPRRGDGRAAPPRDRCFFTSDPAKVGAHAAHVTTSLSRTGGVQCSTCHPVPAEGNVFVGRHADGVVDVQFDPAIVQGGYDSKSGTCMVSCHNRGGARPTPGWQDKGPLKCGDCHTSPPANHYTGNPCSTCHHEANADGTGRTPGPLHVNGKVDLGDGSGKCGACHGQGDDPYPTKDAHPSHQNPKLTTPVACQTCHDVTATPPQDIHTWNHMDGKVQITFSGRAKERLANPSWDGVGCNGVACHGAKLSNPPAINPLWKDPSHLPSTCGTCHGIPPNFHAPSGNCDSTACHGSEITRDAQNHVQISQSGKTLHINGVINTHNP